MYRKDAKSAKESREEEGSSKKAVRRFLIER